MAYYNNAYDIEFLSIVNLVNTRSSGHRIVVRSQVNQFKYIQIRAEIFGSANASQHLKNSFILVKFVQENGSVDVYLR
ncbi:13507_t:CDS:2 [Funneliformis mosseae]|uniref:13507_t:CDS:1 n=1 Tax=Funneliformis mosseae TaxID=27381 RepID=A0A9N9E6J4_FUNMO|nr:13507_t:CDS:2 [Funneliformis mosseae]